jgi:hypothetical protein
MLKIYGTPIPNSNEWDVQIVNAPLKAIIEVRIQSTGNGKESVHLVETDGEGKCKLEHKDFGYHCNTTARILTNDNKETVHEFTILPNGFRGGIVLMTVSDYAERVASTIPKLAVAPPPVAMLEPPDVPVDQTTQVGASALEE